MNNDHRNSQMIENDFSITYPPSNQTQLAQLKNAIHLAKRVLLNEQRDDGHWCYELEADCTIPAEYILMMHFIDEIDIKLEQKLAVYLREHQNEEGGWPLYFGGKSDISASVKAYYALKLIGDHENAPHMEKARQLILKLGGAARSNVFTRIALALFNQVPWRATPCMPVEIMLLPRWFPFHLNKMAYWSRTVVVPLLILCSLKVQAKNPRRINIRELFVTPPDQERHYHPIRSKLNHLFLWGDSIGRKLEPFIPKRIRNHAINKATEWFIARMNGEDGLGAIFPAMVNAYEALIHLGYEKNHPLRQQALRGLQRLLVIKSDKAYCQPCFSPVWDSGLASLALQEEGSLESLAAAGRALDWLKEKQILSGPADWQHDRPNLAPGGWAFEYNNAYYPDLDDTAVVAWAMHLMSDPNRYGHAIERATNWLAGMQSKNGGFAAFDADNTHYHLNEIPFADHGALLDPPTSDVSARCCTLFALLKRDQDREVLQRCLDYILSEQEVDGSWFGRWGTNYIYGTWSVLNALAMAQVSPQHTAVQSALNWLKKRQQPDGGWGEHNDSYYDPQSHHQPSTSYHTAWALLGLMAFGEQDSVAVKRGIDYLINTQLPNGQWKDPWHNAPGFPRVFYLKYHGYCQFFPLWALARYRNLTQRQYIEM